MKQIYQKVWGAAGAFLLSLATFAADGALPIKATSQNPFSDGKRLEQQWKNADILTNFVTPTTLSSAIYQSEAQMSYDSKNLYISLKAFLGTAAKKENVNRSLFSDNNFEIMLKPSANASDYYQIAISENGKIHVSRNRNKIDLPGLQFKTTSSKNFWHAALTIPLNSLGILPKDGEKIRFLFARNNIDTPEKNGEASTFPALLVHDYHVPDTWAEAVFQTASTPQKRVHPACATKVNINLIQNPEFNVAEGNKPVTWSITGDTVRMETAPLSGDWIIRAYGNAYHFMSKWAPLEEGKMYTMKVRARKFGDEGSFGIIQLAKKADGRVGEGSYSAWQIPTSNEFHEFYIPVKIAKGFHSFAFYRIGRKGNDCGVDIDSVKLYEGEISSFEIRKIDRGGVKKVLEGTAPSIPANLYGKTAESMNVLAIVDKLDSARELLEIFSGMNVKCDIIVTTGKNQDVYYSDSDPAAVMKRLKDGAYRLYMVGSHQTPRNIGKELAAKIISHVEKGASLWINSTKDHGNFTAFLKKYPPRAVASDHPLRQGLPRAMAKLPAPWGGWKESNLDQFLVTELPSKGRIVLSETAAWTQQFKLRQDFSMYDHTEFPFGAYADAWLARIACHTAGMVPFRMELSVAGSQAVIKASGAPDGTSAEWSVINKTGKTTASGNVAFKNGSAQITLPSLTLSGNYLLRVHGKTPTGAVADYNCIVFEKKGPAITDFKDKKRFYKGNDDGQFAVFCKGLENGTSLSWELEDFSGRVLEKGRQNAATENNLNVPLKNTYTNLSRLRLKLEKDGKILEERLFPVYVQDRDAKRLADDFTPGIWNAATGISMDACDTIAAQLEKIGIRYYLLPLQGASSALNSGMGLGGTFLGGGDYFCALYPVKNNVRRPSLCDPAVLKSIEKRATDIAEQERVYGVINHGVCDEPNMVFPGRAEESDAHPASIAGFRERMKTKYGTIDAFNKRCGTAYKNFDELGFISYNDARKRSNFAEFIEWRNYNTDRWVEAIRLVSDSGKKGNPDSKLSLYNSFGQGPISGNDYWKLLKNAGLEFSHEYTSMVYLGDNPIYDFDELYRSFRPDLRVWGFNGYYGGMERATFEPWWFAAHRYGGFTWFAATSGTGSGGGSRWLNLLDIPTFAFNEDAGNVKAGLDRSGLLNGLGKLFLEYKWNNNDVAILYSQPSLLTSFCLSRETIGTEIHATGKLHDYFYSRHNIRYLLEYLLRQYDFVAPEQIREGKLNSYKAIFLPGILALSDADVKILRDFAAKGGIIITDFQPGEYDELGVKRAKLPLADLPQDKLIVIGKIFDRDDKAMRSKINALLDKAGAKSVIATANPAELTGREAMRFMDGDMNVYVVLRNPIRSKDQEKQTFTFPTAGHLYDLRNGKYLGKTNKVTVAVPNADAVVYGHYPYQIKGLDVKAPGSVKAGSDLKASIRIIPSEGKAQKHIFHIEVVPPSGKARFHMTRNVSAPSGKYDFVFRMAHNDPKGVWTLKVKDIMSGLVSEKKFTLP